MKNIFIKAREARALKKLARENKGKELSVLDDMVFKIVLSSNDADSKAALRSLLSVCTRREVSDVQVLNSELHPAHLEGKKPRVDVLVTFNDGETLPDARHRFNGSPAARYRHILKFTKKYTRCQLKFYTFAVKFCTSSPIFAVKICIFN